MDRKNREDVSFGKIFKLSIYARVIFELVETIGVTAEFCDIYRNGMDVYFLFWKLSTFTCRIYASGRPSETRRNVVKQSELI